VTEKGIAKNPDLPKKIDSAIIPGLQGGPHNNQTAAIAVCLKEASNVAFRRYGEQIVKNTKALVNELLKYDFNLLTGGSDTHLILIDLRNKRVNGRVAAVALERAGIVLNYNGVPFDIMPPLFASGIRLGTPAITTRGLKEKDMKKVAGWINEAVKEVEGSILPNDDKEKRKELIKVFNENIAENQKLNSIAKEVKLFCDQFPITF